MKHNNITKIFLPLVFLLTLASCDSNVNSSSAVSVNESSSENNLTDIDIFIFMGQSNMAGRGDASQAVKVGENHAFEFRAVTDPTKLYPMTEPFGENENQPGGINDVKGNDGKKLGGLASAFCEAYYQNTHVPVIGVSASQGGTNVDEWQLGEGKLEDAKNRLDLCQSYLNSTELYNIRHINMVWLQGEADANSEVRGPYEYYVPHMQNIIKEMQKVGVENCFVIQVGNYMKSVNETYYQNYKEMQAKQFKWCQEYDNSIMASIKLADMPESMMHLNNHYLQPAYNVVGNDAGKNTAYYINTGKTPTCQAYVEGEEDHINPLLSEGK